jgi:hypothetical protein
MIEPVRFKSLRDIPARLRELADWVERCPDAVRTVIVVSAANDEIVAVNGYGDRASPLEAQGWLAMAAMYINSGVCASGHPSQDGA